VDENFNPSNSLFFRYTSMDQPTVGTGGIVGLDNAADTFAKQYVLSYYHQFNSSTILKARFGHVDLTHKDSAKILQAGDLLRIVVGGAMTKLEVLAIFAQSSSLLKSDNVCQRLCPRPDRRSIYSYLGWLRKQGLLERPATPRRRLVETLLAPPDQSD
jgi:hypothetical protein